MLQQQNMMAMTMMGTMGCNTSVSVPKGDSVSILGSKNNEQCNEECRDNDNLENKIRNSVIFD